MEIPILNVIGLLLGLAVVVLIVFRRFNIPTIIGFIFTGILVGPSVLGVVKASHEIEIMAELGIILLLFIIGLEFSLKTLASIKKAVLLGGLIQVGGTILIPTLLFLLFGFPASHAIFIGFLLALSSTAIVLKMLSERGEINSPHGKIALAILIFQDIIVVPMMLFTPLIAGESDNILLSLLDLLLKAVGVILVVIISARYLVPKLLYIVAKTKNKELFLLTVVTICIATAMMTSYVGLSLALGAFMAGLIISESEYSHQAISNILPFREIFSSIFFISIGMLLDVQFLWENLIPIIGFTVLVLVMKTIIASSAGLILKYPPRTAIHAGLILFQVGEFAFILSRVGLEYGVLTPDVNQYFLSVSIISMAITSFIIPKADELVCKLLNLPIAKPIQAFSDLIGQKPNVEDLSKSLDDHLIIIGFGINGRNVARAARHANIPYLILELNAETVKNEQANGEPILYGDAVDMHILENTNVSKARVVVIAISDPESTKKIIINTRSIAPAVFILVRTRFVKEIEPSLLLGADEVIPEEFETSIQIFVRVLRRYFVSQDDIYNLVEQIREDNYDFLRPNDQQLTGIKPSFFSSLNVAAIRVDHSSNDVVGKQIGESMIREKYGVNIVAIRKESKIEHDIRPDTIIKNGDVLYVSGISENVRKFAERVCVTNKP
jgi:monovalent cation:H+ antiporter-2, CPA2 family